MNKRFILISMCILVIVVFSSVTGFAGTYYGPVLMVEADPAEPVGGDTIVTFTYSLWGSDVSGWQIGEVINNTFNAFEGGSVSKEGGTVVDLPSRKRIQFTNCRIRPMPSHLRVVPIPVLRKNPQVSRPGMMIF